MLDYQIVKLSHRHPEGWFPMTERAHDPATIDPERAWDAGARIFRCESCEAEIAVQPAVDAAPGEGPTGAE